MIIHGNYMDGVKRGHKLGHKLGRKGRMKYRMVLFVATVAFILGMILGQIVTGLIIKNALDQPMPGSEWVPAEFMPNGGFEL